MSRALEEFDLGRGVGTDMDDYELEELVPVGGQESDTASSSVFNFALFMLWVVWIEEVFLGALGGFLSTGAPGFYGRFVYGQLETLGEAWLFIGVSIFCGLILGAKHWRVSSRDAAFSLCRSDIDDYRTDLSNLGSYREHLFEHYQNLNHPELVFRYTQIFRPHDILDFISKKLDKKREFREALQLRYLESCNPGYWGLVIFGVLTTTVSMGGLVCFGILTPNAIFTPHYIIPKSAFMTVAVIGISFGLRQGYKAIKTEMSKYDNEQNLPIELIEYERKTRSKLQLCNETFLDLNEFIQTKSRVSAGMAPSTWTPEKPCPPLKEWIKKREEGATFQSSGFFTSGGAVLFPRRAKPPKLLTGRAAQPEAQEEEVHAESTSYDV